MTLRSGKVRKKNDTQIILRFLSKVVGDSQDKTNFPHKLLLTNTQVSMTHKTFANGSSANIKFSKAELPNMVQLGGSLGTLLEPLLKTGSSLMNALKTLSKSVLIALELAAAESVADAPI